VDLTGTNWGHQVNILRGFEPLEKDPRRSGIFSFCARKTAKEILQGIDSSTKKNGGEKFSSVQSAVFFTERLHGLQSKTGTGKDEQFGNGSISSSNTNVWMPRADVVRTIEGDPPPASNANVPAGSTTAASLGKYHSPASDKRCCVAGVRP